MGRPFGGLLGHKLETSPVVALAAGAATINLEFNPEYSHSFAGVEFYSDSDGDTVVTATLGTIVYTITSPVQPNNALIPFPTNSVDAADNDVVSWGANTLNVRAVITGITGSPTHARLRASGNLT